MIIERDLTPYVVYSGDPVLRALEKITANKARVIFLVDATATSTASLSDGDFRRWVSHAPPASTSTSRAVEAANTSPRSLPIGSTPGRDLATPSARASTTSPLVDERGHLVAVAINRADELRIGRHVVDAGRPDAADHRDRHQPPGRRVDFAKQLVDLSVEAGADIVKFQLRDMDVALPPGRRAPAAARTSARSTPSTCSRSTTSTPTSSSRSSTTARDIGIDVMCTAWDPPSVDRLVDYGIPSLKVASADMTNHALLRHMAASTARRW